MNWLESWLGLRKYLIAAKTQPAGDIEVGVVRDIEWTGYSVEAERMADAKKLMDACREAVAKYPPKKDAQGHVVETYCNFGLQLVAKAMGCDDLAGKTANQILAHSIANPASFVRDTPRRAAEHANKGGFAFAAQEGKEHGHVAAVLPLPMSYSASLKKDVPLLANVGKNNGFLPASMCFPVADGEPLYFLYGETA